ncbi:amino acid adenylation domain-containing protein [Amycolatopsis pigmentata]|uniref:Phenyloxazoline synthase MbtB n=1 Tax=Amycolatopsis pigmentata TaxID=450801 RepID=A0ABW5FKM3_9PSEU
MRTQDLGDRVRLHLSIDLLIADASSIQLLLAEWIRLIIDPHTALPALGVTFRDVLLATAALRNRPAYQRCRRYWLDRIGTLPPAPRLPVRDLPAAHRPEFTRREHRFSPATWAGLRDRARASRVTPSMLLCAAYAEVLRVWSSRERFTLNVTVAQRPGGHPGVAGVIGDFTGTVLLECELTGSPDLATTAATIQRQLRADLAHAEFTGVLVQRELARTGTPDRARMPIVFTSLLTEPDGVAAFEDVVFATGYAISQTPQVLLDNQVLVRGEGLLVSWDAVDTAFAAGVLDDMFAAYTGLLHAIADDEHTLRLRVPVTAPRRQLDARAAVNDTAGPLPRELLHAGIDRWARHDPDAPAVLTADRTLTFGELDRRANQVAHWLRSTGAGPNSLVGVLMRKGWEQVVAVLGILRAGAAYLPIDADLPPLRVARVLDTAGAEPVVVQTGVTGFGARRALVVEAARANLPDGPVESPRTAVTDLAYVIFTSGSTGAPKGVMVSHRAAGNTLADINDRLGVGPGDRVLGLSALSFDLSVYDIFGVLGAGGAIVLPDADEVRNPAHWESLTVRHGVTLWNSVPALLEMLVEHRATAATPLPATLRAVLLSGDWIPLPLVRRLHAGAGPLIYGLGGATEAGIWSIWQPITAVDPEWRSVPYGTPLRNQAFRVLDSRFADKPDLVAGELFIGGSGLADGYWADPALTAAAFPAHPDTGERLYRTGDTGRYLTDGSIEFLGRLDTQVKIGGHRIELGDIEAALAEHDQVRAAVAVATGPDGGPRRLVGYVVPTTDAGLDLAELRDFLAARLPAYQVPPVIVALTALPLGPNGKVERAALPPPPPAEPAQPPAGDAERTLAEIWRSLLGTPHVGRDTDFFALGGDSLLSVRAVALAAEAGLHLSAAEFCRHPTVAGQAALARSAPPPTAPEEPAEGPVGLTPSQHWFFAQEVAEPDHWNGMWPVFALGRLLDTAVLARALDIVLARHEALRTRFHRARCGWRAEIVAARPSPAGLVEAVGLAHVADHDLEAEIGAHVARRNGGLDLANGPVVTLTSFDLGARRAPRLLVSAHWLVMDYYSSRVFYEELRVAYFALERGENPVLPPKTASLRACLARLAECVREPEAAGELPYWTELAGRRVSALPVDHRIGPNTQASAARVLVQLTGATADAVLARPPAARGVEIRDVLITALVRTIAGWTDVREVAIELEGHGREWAYGDLDVSRTVGRLSTLTPVLLRTGDLRAVRDQLAAVPHRGAGYGILRELHHDPEVRARLATVPAPEVGFNFWGEVSEYFTADSRPVIESFGHHRGESGLRPRVLDLTALTVAGELWLVWTYSTNLHTEATITALAGRFERELAELARDAR